MFHSSKKYTKVQINVNFENHFFSFCFYNSTNFVTKDIYIYTFVQEKQSESYSLLDVDSNHVKIVPCYVIFVSICGFQSSKEEKTKLMPLITINSMRLQTLDFQTVQWFSNCAVVGYTGSSLEQMQVRLVSVLVQVQLSPGSVLLIRPSFGQQFSPIVVMCPLISSTDRVCDATG